MTYIENFPVRHCTNETQRNAHAIGIDQLVVVQPFQFESTITHKYPLQGHMLQPALANVLRQLGQGNKDNDEAGHLNQTHQSEYLPLGQRNRSIVVGHYQENVDGNVQHESTQPIVGPYLRAQVQIVDHAIVEVHELDQAPVEHTVRGKVPQYDQFGQAFIEQRQLFAIVHARNCAHGNDEEEQLENKQRYKAHVSPVHEYDQFEQK